MTQRTVLVTGASGLVGRMVTAAYEDSGWRVHRLTRQVCDLARESDLTRHVDRPPDLLIHLAAVVPTGVGRADTAAAGAATRHMDSVICQAVRAWQCPLIYASSCGLYRRDLPAINDESAPVSDWQSPYFAAKLAGEAATLDLPRSTVLRLSSPVGPDIPPHLVLARFVALARADADLPLYGDGMREQDFISRHDLAALFLAAAQPQANGIYNAASGATTTMAALAATVIDVIGRGRVVLSGKPESTNCLFARYDVARAQESLGWVPRVGLPAMIADAAGGNDKVTKWP